MPQMEFADYAPQIVWLVLTFGILYLLMLRVTLPRITNVLESREQRITKDFERAEILGRDAKIAENAYRTTIIEAQAKARTVSAQTREDLQSRQANKISELETMLESEMANSEIVINEAREKAMSDLGGINSELAEMTTEKLLGDSLGNVDFVNVEKLNLEKD